MRSMMFAIKAEVSDPWAETFAFSAQKTMYGGKHIAKGDTIFVFASENEGGPGLIASGVVTSAKAIARKRGIARQTPRVSITIRRTALAKRRLGRSELKLFSDWNDGRPETEFNFKFYRQATNKIVGISDEAALFLRGFFNERISILAINRLSAVIQPSVAAATYGVTGRPPLQKICDVHVATEQREIVEPFAGADKTRWNSKFILNCNDDPTFAASIEFCHDQSSER